MATERRAGRTAEPAAERAARPRLSRRQRYRQATIEEIKTFARAQLAEQGPAALSLRAISRQMDVASSALYRYFPSRDDLLSALCADTYQALAEVITAARDAPPAGDHHARWLAILQAYRAWSLANPADFALIFGTPVPGYHAPVAATGPAAARSLAVPLQVYADAVAAGHADPDRTRVPPDLQPGPLLQALLDYVGSGYPPRLAAIVLAAWMSVRGFITSEVFGSLRELIADTDQLYRAHLRTITDGMGYRSS